VAVDCGMVLTFFFVYSGPSMCLEMVYMVCALPRFMCRICLFVLHVSLCCFMDVVIIMCEICVSVVILCVCVICVLCQIFVLGRCVL